MGCVFSRTFDDNHPHIFHVWNVDERGNHINPGRMEITETDIILHQKGKPPIYWPLRSLRRYGFDAELFSFESGRRCPTGPGIYAFKCRRAEILFNLLQEFIQNSTGLLGGHVPPMIVGNDLPNNTMVTSNGSIPNGNIVSNAPGALDADGYLEPLPASLQHRPSTVSVGSRSLTSNDGRGWSHAAPPISSPPSQISPGHSTIVLSPTSAGNVSATARSPTSLHYMNEDIFTIHRSGSLSGALPGHPQYVNSCVAVKPRLQGLQEGEVLYSGGQVHICPVGKCQPGSCSAHCSKCVDVNTNYAKLDDLMKQESSGKKPNENEHFYMNVTTSDVPSNSASTSLTTCGNSTDGAKPKMPSSQFYANIKTKTSTTNKSNATSVESEDDKQVNYIVLDLENNEATNVTTDDGASIATTSSATTLTVNPNSSHDTPTRTGEGYVTIDFDKTAALSISVNSCGQNDDSVRKTRHNGTIPPCALQS